MFIKQFNCGVKDAAELVGNYVCSDKKTVRTWRMQFYKNVGSFPLSSKGKYVRPSVLDEEDIKERAIAWLRHNMYSKKTQVTAHSFMKFINEDLLPSYSDLPENAPTQISLRSAYRWLHKIGFGYQEYKQGTFVDGHERSDVVKYRKMHASVDWNITVCSFSKCKGSLATGGYLYWILNSYILQ